MKYAEDLTAGSVTELGEYQVTEDEIISFARQWDPLSIHTDPETAASGYFGGVIASGIHTLGVLQRLAVLAVYHDWAIIAGRRIREIRLPAPVRGGAVLAGRLIVAEVTPTKPDRSLLVIIGELRDGPALVLQATFETYVRRRPSGDPEVSP